MPATLDRPVPAHHRRPDIATERRQQQDEIRRLPELREELRAVAGERDELQSRVDVGELTPRAMENVCRRWYHLADRISAATSTYRHQLVATAPEHLREQFGVALATKAKCLQRHHACQQEVDRLNNEHRIATKRYEELCERQADKMAVRWSDDDHKSVQRDIARLERELDAARDDLADAGEQVRAALAAVGAARAACIAA